MNKQLKINTSKQILLNKHRKQVPKNNKGVE